MSIYNISNGDGSTKIREGLNDNAIQLRQTRRPWTADFDGSFCTHNGKDYDLTPGGTAAQTPGNVAHWTEKQYLTPASTTTTPAGGLQYKRGPLTGLKAEPVNSLLDLFIVQGEVVNEFDEDMNGNYWRTASGAAFIWMKE